jgi:hypothetical protein
MNQPLSELCVEYGDATGCTVCVAGYYSAAFWKNT